MIYESSVASAYSRAWKRVDLYPAERSGTMGTALMVSLPLALDGGGTSGAPA